MRKQNEEVQLSPTASGPMIVQACLNGARPRGFHSRLPLQPAELAREGAAAVTAGAAELHVHAHDADERESLAAVDATVMSIRHACPGTLIGVSTGAWIEKDCALTCAAIATWRERPDYASVNLSEPDAPAVMAQLRRVGVGIEAGLASPADAERLVGLAGDGPLVRILIEVEQQDEERAIETAEAIAAVLERAGLRRAILAHGFEDSVWPMVQLARRHRWSTRVGLEDGQRLPDGRIATDNAALVAAAFEVIRRAAC